MQEKYYINIDENRKILGRYLLSIHGENIPSTAQEVSEEVFNISISKNHDFVTIAKDGTITTSIYELTEEEIAEQEAEAEAQKELVKAEKLLELYELLEEMGVEL